MTYITYERPCRLHDRELDPFAPDADLSPTGDTCGEIIYDIAGFEWTCSRRPHTESEHRAAYAYRDEGPQGEVAIAWESNWGEPAARPTTTTTVTTRITHPTAVRQCPVTDNHLDSIQRPVWETFGPDDHVALTTSPSPRRPHHVALTTSPSPRRPHHVALTTATTVAEADAATAGLARLVDVLSADGLTGDLAAALSCTASDAIADVLRTHGAAGAVHRWIRHHADHDELGDLHHSPARAEGAASPRGGGRMATPARFDRNQPFAKPCKASNTCNGCIATLVFLR